MAISHATRRLSIPLAAFSGLVWLSTIGTALAQKEPLDRIVAVVNDGVILESELNQEIRSARASVRGNPSDEVLARQVLEQLIMMSLQAQIAERSGLRVSEARVNAALEEMANANNVGLAEFRDLLELEGYDFELFRDRVRAQILVGLLHQRQVSKVTVSEHEIRAHLANEESAQRIDPEVLVAQILVALPDGASPEEIAEGREEADAIVAWLDTGEDFAYLAISESDGRNALQGGEIGWRKPSDLPAAFADALRGLNEGEYSRPVRTASGFHIIKILRTRGAQSHVVRQTRARHILLKPGELVTEAEVVARLEGLHKRIVNGDDFGALARAHSDDRGSALRDGDLGWLNPGVTVPEFEREMDALESGEVSEPFRTQFGWHVVQVLERRDHDGTEEVRRVRAEAAIRRRKSDEELQTWMSQQRDQAYVDLRLEEYR
ncbi:MAG: molecular chaperone SurA [Gammaproteobacteria bacterium]|nr:molecular chaperone SurA [Gammaproteobacteria bacterium]